MRRFLLRRVGQVIGTIFGVVTLIFFLQRLTGDPTYLLVPETATQADIDAMRAALGFDRPLIVQYLAFLKQIASFDLGRSVIQNVPVWDIIASRLPYTLQLADHSCPLSGSSSFPVARERRSGGAEHADLLERDHPDLDLRRDAGLASSIVNRRH
jgi:peptide/nickel transport system permease protein